MGPRRALAALGWRFALEGPGGGGPEVAGAGGSWVGGALRARPDPGAAGPRPAPGVRPLQLDTASAPLLAVPAGLPPDQPPALVLTLHGAGGDAQGGLALLRPLADERGIVLLAPASQGATWDGVGGRPGPDLEVIDRALDEVFRSFPVDPRRVGVTGFSDGASYALSLGLANGELFSRVLAFSPGFVPPARRVGRPAVFVAHGRRDEVLPVRASRRIVTALDRDGYDVAYREFDGPHTVPPHVVREAVDWLGWAGTDVPGGGI